MHKQATVKMDQLLLLCVKLSMESCGIVKYCYQNKEVKQYSKGVDDPVTQADFKIQTMLIKGIRKHYPNIKIVGEEENQFQGHIQTNYQKLNQIQLPKQAQTHKQYQLDKLCIWIDPIDNTRGFIQGEAEAVTVLIGISYAGTCQVGIVGHPFKKQANGVVYNPSTIFGWVSQKHAYQIYQDKRTWIKLKPPTKQHGRKPISIMSSTRSNVVQSKIAKQINAQIQMAGGCGYKCLLIGKGQAQLFTYCQSYSKKWDTCAGEAIIRALGGYFIQTNGNEYVYDCNAKNFVNKEGLICGFDQQIKKVSLEVVKKHKQSKL